MAENSRIKFNPVTKEIEVAGSESFVKTYFNKLQELISGSPEKTVVVKEKPIKVKAAPKKKEPKTIKVAPVKADKMKPKAVKARPPKKATKSPAKKASKVATGTKRGALSMAVLTLIQSSTEGVSMAELKEKTGLEEVQIRNIISSITKQGKIRKVKRGVYAGVTETKE
jgi:hypothetical protein